MKVLTIISKLEMGGIEKTLLSCLPYLIENGVQMSILCSLGGELDGDYKALGVELIDFDKHKKPFKDAMFLKQLLSEKKFDIVHSRYGHTSGPFAKVCYNLNIPFLVSIHNERAMFRNNWIDKPILSFLRTTYLNYHKKLTLKYATKIIGHSKANLCYFTSKVGNLSPESQFQVLYNGVDFTKFEDYPALSAEKRQELDRFLINANKIFVHVGSFKEQKNHHFLIDVFKGLCPIKNNYYLILLGVGSLIDDVKDYAAAQGIESHILFAGMQIDIAYYLVRSNLFVFPSLYEGFGNVLIEAQYLNLPVAASAIAPHYEATEKGYHRFLYNPTNVNEAIEKIEALLETDLDDQKEKARIFAKRFSVENMVNNLMQIYKNAVNGN